MDTDLEALGTNAHELPMVLAALARSDEELREAPYRVLQDWKSYYGGNLLIVLPDAFGTDAFLRDAPDWVADWTGFPPRFGPAIEGGEKDHPVLEGSRPRPARKAAYFFRRAGRRHDRGGVPAFRRQGAHELWLGHQSHQRLRGLRARAQSRLNPISIVAKVSEANGRPAVKLSDNPGQGHGEAEAIARYIRVLRRCRTGGARRQGVTGLPRPCPSVVRA